MVRSLVALAAALSLLASPACKRPAPDLTKATVKVDDEGVLVNGSRVSAILRDDRKLNVPPVLELLRADRESWEKLHPGSPFVGVVALEVPAETAVGAGVSVASTVAAAGFTQIDAHSGDVTARLDYWRGPASDPRELVRVERDDTTRGFKVRFAGEPTPRLGHRHAVADASEAAKVIAREWATGPERFERGLVLRIPSGTFHDALLLARTFLALPELARATVSFEIGVPTQ